MAAVIKLAKLLVPIEGDTSKFQSAITKSQGLTDTFVSSVGKAGKVLSTGLLAGATAAAGGVVAVGIGLGKLATESAPLYNVAQAFDGIATAAGSSGEQMLAAFDKATAGMVDHETAMMSYNKAAQLVGDEFAGQLPEAMGHLGKVAAATGQDMGFMLDSLVTGVGRLSPMILDNLGIQVSLNEANERAAEMYGVATDELTKEQQQAGMMNVVLEKLAKNTAAMPDITQSAAGQMAAFKSAIKNAKDEIGMKLVPILGKLLTAFKPIIDKALPTIINLFEKYVVPVVDEVINIVGTFISVLFDTGDPLEALKMALGESGFAEVVPAIQGVIGGFEDFIDKIKEVIAAIQPYIEMAVGWVKEHVKLQDVLIALGIAIASVVVPAIISMVVAAAPIVLAIGAVIAIVVLLREAWENNFLGIRDIAATVWGWLQTFIPQAIETIKEVIDTVLTAIKKFWEDHGAAIMKLVDAMWTAIKTTFETVIGIVKKAVEWFLGLFKKLWGDTSNETTSIVDTLWNTIQSIFEFVMDLLTKIFQAWTALFSGDWETFMELLKDIWETIWNAISAFFATIAQLIYDKAVEFIGWVEGVWNTFVDNLETWWNDTWDAIKQYAEDTWQKIVQAVEGWVQSFIDEWDKFWDRITAIGTELVGKIKSGISNAWTTIKDAVSGWVGSIKQWFIDALGPIASIGTAIVDKIKSGITSAWDSFVSWISNKINSIISSILGAIGIGGQSAGFPGIDLNVSGPRSQGANFAAATANIHNTTTTINFNRLETPTEIIHDLELLRLL